ncbi:MAG: mannose-6-phosphate isomerase [Phycisphaerae bacterium]|nr:MAG: mannose-6-phosphate isomerase [Phycisphaerae bacterium]
MTTPSPLIFRPILLDKVWGGDRLARFGKAVAPGAKVGESWELADLGATAASGAGGGAQRSIIANGPFAGRTLHDAMEAWGAAMLGRAAKSPAGEFPLLVKFLDARENLSVQVHPSPAYAAAHPGAHLKTECWYILHAEPGSVLYKGVKRGVTRDAFAAHIASGSVVNDLVAVPAVPGEVHALPSGTCHALGAGVLVAEVQTPSDTTFRVFDWGRTGRALHVEESLACIEFGPAPEAVKLRSGGAGFGSALTTDYFTLRHLSLGNDDERPISPGGAMAVVLVLGGAGSLYSDAGAFAPVDLRVGMTVLVPAGVAGEAQVSAGELRRVECLVATVP